MDNKFALIIGINYFNTDFELSGCINDTKMLRRYLLDNNFIFDNITVLRDDGCGNLGFLNKNNQFNVTNSTPTKNNIVNSIKQLVHISNNNSNSEFFLSYSGHGSYILDEDNDEDDSQDEVIVPLDFNENGYLSDDEIRYLLKDLHPSTKLYVLMDCCNSGTNMDLPYIYEYDNDQLLLKQNNSQKYGELLNKNIWAISGCRDNQTSADLYEVYQYDTDLDKINKNDIIHKFQISGGALTSSFLKVGKKRKLNEFINIYKDILNPDFKNNFTQVPLLSSSNDILNNSSESNYDTESDILLVNESFFIPFLKKLWNNIKNFIKKF